jgi:hypothetical protein
MDVIGTIHHYTYYCMLTFPFAYIDSVLYCIVMFSTYCFANQTHPICILTGTIRVVDTCVASFHTPFLSSDLFL